MERSVAVAAGEGVDIAGDVALQFPQGRRAGFFGFLGVSSVCAAQLYTFNQQFHGFERRWTPFLQVTIGWRSATYVG